MKKIGKRLDKMTRSVILHPAFRETPNSIIKPAGAGLSLKRSHGPLAPKTRGRMMNMDVLTLQKLGRQIVLDENGNPEMLSALWQEKRVVLVFIRHFG
jgi:tartrate dehydratase beta subunit/fumarate hydratase class I family protein